jgi:hypothetical protein
VVYAYLVTAFKTAAISLAIPLRHMRMTKLVTIVHIRPAVIILIFASAFDAVVEPMAMNFVQLRRGSIPIMGLTVTCVHRRRGSGWNSGSFGRECPCRCKSNDRRSGSNPYSSRTLHSLSSFNFSVSPCRSRPKNRSSSDAGLHR